MAGFGLNSEFANRQRIHQDTGLARINEKDDKSKTLKLWVRRKGGNPKMECSGCGRRVTKIYDVGERRDHGPSGPAYKGIEYFFPQELGVADILDFHPAHHLADEWVISTSDAKHP